MVSIDNNQLSEQFKVLRLELNEQFDALDSWVEVYDKLISNNQKEMQYANI